jgi:hypothetical protein
MATLRQNPYHTHKIEKFTFNTEEELEEWLDEKSKERWECVSIDWSWDVLNRWFTIGYSSPDTRVILGKALFRKKEFEVEKETL